MVQFKVGYNRYDAGGANNPLVENLVETLNEVFDHNKCPIHPNEKWSIEVDLMKNGHLQFATMKQDGCSYGLRLIEDEIYPFLEEQQIFPLPSH